MLEANWRIILCLFVASPACATSPDRLIGLWRNTNDERFAEIELREDRSFTLLSRNNAILAVVPLQEQFGTWLVDRDRLILDATDRYSKERSRKRLKLVDVARDRLRIKLDEHTDTYRRVHLPKCSGPVADIKHAVRDEDLIGTWRCHYRTHDYEFAFQRSYRVTVSGADPPARPRKMFTWSWKLTGNTLTMKAPNAAYNAPDEKTVWTITQVGAQCFIFRDGSSMSYVLQRLR